MADKYNAKDLMTAIQFAKKHGLKREDVELAMKKLRGLMMDPPKDSPRQVKKPVIVVTGNKNGRPKVNFGADEIVIAKVYEIQNNGK